MRHHAAHSPCKQAVHRPKHCSKASHGMPARMRQVQAGKRRQLTAVTLALFPEHKEGLAFHIRRRRVDGSIVRHVGQPMDGCQLEIAVVVLPWRCLHGRKCLEEERPLVRKRRLRHQSRDLAPHARCRPGAAPARVAAASGSTGVWSQSGGTAGGGGGSRRRHGAYRSCPARAASRLECVACAMGGEMGAVRPVCGSRAGANPLPILLGTVSLHNSMGPESLPARWLRLAAARVPPRGPAAPAGR